MQTNDPTSRSLSHSPVFWIYIIAAVAIGTLLLLNLFYRSNLFPVAWLWECARPVLVGTLIFFAAFVLGRLVLIRLKSYFSPTIGYACMCAGLGLGLLGLLMLMLGMFSVFHPLTAYGMIIVILLAGLLQIKSIRQGAYEFWQSLSRHRLYWPTRLLLLLLISMAALVLADNFAPVVSYDAAEYHLGGISEFIKRGQIARIDGNFYTALPFHVEMLFGLGLLLEGGAGASPKIINALIYVLSLFTMFALAGHVTRRRAFQFFAAALFAVHPLIFKISIVGKNDLGLTLFVMLALLAWLEWLHSGRRIHLALMGVFIGFALGCKYTSIGMFLIPAMIALIPAGLLPPREDGNDEGAFRVPPFGQFWPKLLRAEFIFLIFALLIFLPWGMKNLILYGNPVYPLLPTLFQSDSFTPFQYHFYWTHHGGASPWQIKYWTAAFERLDYFSPLFWMPFPGVVVLRHNRLRGWSLVGFVLLGHMAAALMTQNPDRFQSPLVPVIILGLILLLSNLYERRRAAAWLAAPYILWIVAMGYVHLVGSLGDGLVQHALHMSQFKTDHQMKQRLLGEAPAEAFQYIQQTVPRDSTVLMLYEARWYYFPQPVVGNTVFDKSALLDQAREAGAESGKDLLRHFQKQGINFIFVNEFELLRMIRQIAPERYLFEAFPGLKRSDFPRETLQSPEFIPSLLSHWELYPPYLPPFASDFRKYQPAISEFLQIAEERKVYESNPPPAPRIWIADLRPKS